MQEQKFKADAGKPDHSLLELGFPNALAFVQATLDYGAKKYEAHSWRKVPNALARYDAAARRHRKDRDRAVSAELHSLSGVCNAPLNIMARDTESGLPHIAHELFNLMAVIELWLERNPIDVQRMLKYNEPPTEHKQPLMPAIMPIAPTLPFGCAPTPMEPRDTFNTLGGARD